jgi:hypothetical protein
MVGTTALDTFLPQPAVVFLIRPPLAYINQLEALVAD